MIYGLISLKMLFDDDNFRCEKVEVPSDLFVDLHIMLINDDLPSHDPDPLFLKNQISVEKMEIIALKNVRKMIPVKTNKYKRNDTSYGAFCRLWALYILTRNSDPMIHFGGFLSERNLINIVIADDIIILKINRFYDKLCHSYTMYGRTASEIKSMCTIFRWWSSSKLFTCNDIRISATNSNSIDSQYLVRTLILPKPIVDKIRNKKDVMGALNRVLFHLISSVYDEEQINFLHKIGCGTRRKCGIFDRSKLTLSLLDTL